MPSSSSSCCSSCFGPYTRVVGELGHLDEPQLRRFVLGGTSDDVIPSTRSLKEGWLLHSSSSKSKVRQALEQLGFDDRPRRVFARLHADALAIYETGPTTSATASSSRYFQYPTQVLFLSSVSAILGMKSDVIRCVHTRGIVWELRQCPDDSVGSETLKEWAQLLFARHKHFKQAKRQSQRITTSVLAKLSDPSGIVTLKLRRKLRSAARRCMPCLDACFLSTASGTQFALTARLGSVKEPSPYRGDVDFHSELVDPAKLLEVSDPELQEAQGAHWSELAVKFLRATLTIPEEIKQDFVLTLRMGAPDGLKRLVWPLAAGEAIEPPRKPSGTPIRSGKNALTRDAQTMYESYSGRAFGGVDPKTIQLRDPVPTFCQGIGGIDDAPPLKAVVKHLELLNEEGQRALRRLLWVIQLTCHQVEFCPFLPNLMCTLLAFFTEAETISIVMCILREAEKEKDPDNAFNVRLMVNSAQLNKQAKVFVREGSRKPLTGQALRHLESLGFDLHFLAAKLLHDGLASRLPFRAFCRVVGSWLCEGSQVMVRYGLALIKLRSEELVACPTKEEAERELSNLGAGLTNFDALEAWTKAAFSRLIEDNTMVRVNSNWGSDFVAPRSTRRHVFCRPRLFPPRGLCPDVVWEAVWSWVPTSSRIFDPHLVYSPSMNGTSLRSMLEICKKHSESPMIFFCYTKEGDVIGGYSPNIWVRTHGYLKANQLRRPAEDAFVFRSLIGGTETEVWPWSGGNEMLLDASELHGLCFGSQNAAVFINKDMTRCTSSSSATFGSPMLVSPHRVAEGAAASSVQECGKETADFELVAFEVFALQ
mmetsp:Transcript_1114/g.2454  ORF Transcript_1114/g.2454 Transcript_1114/m.2454 type:complete len:820 (-) Transcript_1114:50-2509(-)|eukprot:CAMPEP_0206433144 /NCGR_PEP_ID=MMETSP0324_2-20121206/8359_1 /ASSEMBLY_ACC=CAM_ASM_000836 /TAXON_ID=2866 /ORGANISM="Crypthecodinium cohnii, Strain Seligo" /LENGTH=819 /DNA_ID=CAMNT_0053899355 /DNA_START=75 /DNA_END=2534 /DNA_ORIENTATION=+